MAQTPYFKDRPFGVHGAFVEREVDAPKVSLTKGEFVTFCQLSDAGCAFIVHVPEYR